jgi:hypothetical protein
MRKIKDFAVANWSYILTLLFSSAALASFLWLRIVSTPTGYSPGEWIIHNNLAAKTYTFSYLFHHVVFAPYYLALMVPEYLNRYGLLAIRSVGAIFGFACVVIFFYIIWRWWGTLIALLSSLVFTTSFWFLQISRNQGPTILYILAALIIILLGFVVRNKKIHDTKTLLSALIALILLYIPGMIWFVLVACILQRKFIKKEFTRIPIQIKLIIPIAGLILILPLIHACYNNLSELKTLVGFPMSFSFKAFLDNLGRWPLVLFVRNPIVNSFTIGHLPVLSIFNEAMFILGSYWIWTKRKLNRIYLLGVSVGVAWILYGLGGPVSIYLALPFIMCVVATGIAYILGQWFTVFPKNPVARSVGMAILTIAVFAVCLYHSDQYFIAWPKTPTTISDYSTHK